MKKYSTPILIFAVLTIIISGHFVFSNPSDTAHAVESVKTADSSPMPLDMAKESTDGAAMKLKSEYALPYPGILPDHPLYFLKDFRDKNYRNVNSRSRKKVRIPSATVR